MASWIYGTAVARRARLAAAALLASLPVIVSAPVFAADHRDATMIDEEPPADLADVYLFRDPADSNFVILALTVNGFSNPQENDSYSFAPGIIYQFNIDQNGDGIAETAASIVFSEPNAAGQAVAAALPGGIVIQGLATPGTSTRTPLTPIINQGPQGTVLFAGQRDDPFFFDIVGFRRLVAGVGTFRGIDSFAGQNVSAIVLRLPIASVFGSGTKVGVWGATYRYGSGLKASDGNVLAAQADREGNPAVNVALVPPAMKNAFNAGQPVNDARDFGPTIVAVLTALGTSPANQMTLASVALPDTLKYDRTQPDGYPNGRRLQDDVIDTLLTLIFNRPTSDGVNGNDLPFLTTFPFMAAPQQPQ